MARRVHVATLVAGIVAILLVGFLLFVQTRDPMLLIFAGQAAVVVLVIGLIVLFRPRGKT